MFAQGRKLLGSHSLLAAAALSAAAYSSYGFDEGKLLQVAQADAPKPAGSAKGALNPNEFVPFKLVEKQQLTHDTYRYRFELPKDQTSGMTVASCLVTRAFLKEKETDEKPKAVVRPYTPTSPHDAKGYMDLVVKVYPKGKMGPFINGLKVGDTLDMKGPIPKYPYTANIKKKIGMVAGGSGITPMLQVVDYVLANPEDKTELYLIFANRSEADIILKDKIDALAAKHKDRFHVYYVVDKPNWFGLLWSGGTGFLTKDMVKAHLPPPGKDNLVMVCGPPGMMEAISGNKAPDYSQGELKGMLKDLGYDSSMVYKF